MLSWLVLQRLSSSLERPVGVLDFVALVPSYQLVAFESPILHWDVAHMMWRILMACFLQ